MTLNSTRARKGVLFLPLLFLLACGGPSHREGVTPTQAHMYAHYDRAAVMHYALVTGDLERARQAAGWIAAHPDRPDLDLGDSHHENAVRAFARLAVNSAHLQAASVAAARMASSCGDCHIEQGVNPRFLMGTATPGGNGPRAEMARHVWAAERMWVGLLGPSDAAWVEGANGLEGGWLDTQEVLADPDDRQRIREMVRHIYDLAGRAETATSVQDRAQIYGEFLNTCADCHRLTLARSSGQ